MILSEHLINEAIKDVTRVEFIEANGAGRGLSRWNLTKIEIQLQDDGRTLKVFFEEAYKYETH